MLPTSTSEKVKLSVFRPPAGCSSSCLSPTRRAQSISPMGAYRPMKITAAVEMLKNRVLADAPRKSEPLFAAAVVNS